MAATIFQGEHHLGQLLCLHLMAKILLADIPVLAEDAGEVAAGEEDGARARVAHQGRLLPKVRSIAGHPGPPAGAAVAPLIFQAVHLAAAGTDLTGLEKS